MTHIMILTGVILVTAVAQGIARLIPTKYIDIFIRG